MHALGGKRYCVAGFPTLPPSGPDDPPLVGEIRVLAESETDPGTYEVQHVIKADDPDLDTKLESLVNGQKDQD